MNTRFRYIINFLRGKPKVRIACLIGLLFLLLYINSVAQTEITKRFDKTFGQWSQANDWTPAGLTSSNNQVIPPFTLTIVSQAPNLEASSPLNSIPIQGNAGTINFSRATNNGTLVITRGLTVQSGRTPNIDRMTMSFSESSSSVGESVMEIISLVTPGVSKISIIDVNGDLTLSTTGFVTQNNSGTFSLHSGGTLRIGPHKGIRLSGNNVGNIRTSIPHFYLNANCIYVGSANQTIGNNSVAYTKTINQDLSGFFITRLIGTVLSKNDWEMLSYNTITKL